MQADCVALRHKVNSVNDLLHRFRACASIAGVAGVR